jgi:hypothetical protein
MHIVSLGGTNRLRVRRRAPRKFFPFGPNSACRCAKAANASVSVPVSRRPGARRMAARSPRFLYEGSGRALR